MGNCKCHCVTAAALPATPTLRALVADGNSWCCLFPKALRNAAVRRLRIRYLALRLLPVVDIFVVAAVVVVVVALQAVSGDLLAVATNCQFDHSMFE